MPKHGKYNLVFWIGLVFMHCEQNIKIGIASNFDLKKYRIEKPFSLHSQWKMKPKLKIGSNLFCIVKTKRCFSKWKTSQHWSLKNCFTPKFNIGKRWFFFLKKKFNLVLDQIAFFQLYGWKKWAWKKNSKLWNIIHLHPRMIPCKLFIHLHAFGLLRVKELIL